MTDLRRPARKALRNGRPGPEERKKNRIWRKEANKTQTNLEGIKWESASKEQEARPGEARAPVLMRGSTPTAAQMVFAAANEC